jgi:glucosamine--fructose-6-phosphate aminotransferase (isomerizing)
MASEIMHAEILQQPRVCADLIDREAPGLLKVLKALKAKRPKGILMAARGSSDHAAIYGRYLLEHLCGVPVALAAPSLVTTYKAKPRLKDWLVIGVSQSGQGPDINAVVSQATRQGAYTIGITNDPRSGLAKASRHVLHLGAEKEQAVAATKTFTTELAGLGLLGVLWSGDKKLRAALDKVPQQMDSVLQQTEAPVERVARSLKKLNACVVVGRGYQMGVAHEMGLKMKECAGVPALSYSVADFAHGPVSLAQKGFPVFYVSGPGRLEQESLAYTRDFLDRGAKVYRVGLRDKGVAKLKRHKALDLSMLANANAPEPLTPLLSILPGQWFAYYNALAKGLDPANPKGLKKVTKTK